MQLTHIAGRDVTVPVRFGRISSPEHVLHLRFGDVQHDGSLAGHLIASVHHEVVVARHAIVWDPVLRAFSLGDQLEIERIAGQLDPLTGVLGFVARGAMGALQATCDLISELLNPRFFVIGGIGTIVATYIIYYALWAWLSQILLWYVILPGFAAAVICAFLHHLRVSRLREALVKAAWRSLGGLSS